MPTLAFFAYLIFYLSIFQLSVFSFIARNAQLFSTVLALIATVVLFGIGLFLKTYPMDHWPYVRTYLRKKYFEAIDEWLSENIKIF